MFDATTPIEEVEAALPQDELDRLSALGDQRDATRWEIGDKAREWIDDRGLPVYQICKIIGKRTDYSERRVRDFLYVSRFYHERPDLREKYSLLRYSIFEHAKDCSNPEEVLATAQDYPTTPAVTIRQIFPGLMDEARDLYNRVPAAKRDEARLLTETYLAKLRELIER